MKLLFDTDAFCKLGMAGLLKETADLFLTELIECGRLPALPYMLQKGRLRKVFGSEVCDSLVEVAKTLPIPPSADDKLLEELLPINDIDTGEAQLFAIAAEQHLLIVSGDKRALRALKNVNNVVEPLAGRIVVLESLLLGLCNNLGAEEMRRRVAPLIPLDKVVRVCCSSGNPDLEGALRSYHNNLIDELKPIILWSPFPGGGI